MRRPNLISWNTRMDDIVDKLLNSVPAHSSDRLLCEFVKVEQLCHTIGSQLALTDPGRHISAHDPETIEKIYKSQWTIDNWFLCLPNELQNCEY